MLVQDFLQNSAATYPDKTALVFNKERYTYAELESKTNRLANALIECGIERSDRVVIFLPNSVETVCSIFAILKASATFVVVNPTTKVDKLVYILNNCNASALITSYTNASLGLDVVSKVPSLKLVVLCRRKEASAAENDRFYDYNSLMESHSNSLPMCHCIDQDLACLIYTSGSTGDPKGVVSGHNNMIFVSNSVITYLENTPDDIVINVLPLSFDYGLYQLLMVFRFGGTLVLETSFTYVASVLQRMESEKVTGLPGVPTLFSILVNMDLGQYDLSSLRYITNTAAALPPKHITELREKFPWATIYSMYGLTESKRTLYLPPEQIDKRPGSVGIAIPGTEVWIEDEDGNRVKPGEVGELVIRGSHVMRGYWNDPETTNRVYRSGPTPGERILFSGDLFKMDDEGYLYFVSRKDDIIKSRGEKVSPKEIENVLYSMDEVIEAAIVGIPDAILGQAIKAYVVLKSKKLNENDIKLYCKKHLEVFMIPNHVEIVESLPKTSSGKISKKELR